MINSHYRRTAHPYQNLDINNYCLGDFGPMPLSPLPLKPESGLENKCGGIR